MIAYVSGKLVEKKPTEVVIDVQGLGYRILIPTSTYETLPSTGERATLFTHYHVREDAHQLYGFSGKAERTLFETLISVSGIGPKLALAVLSAVAPAELREHIAGGDVRLLTSIPGIGRKTAERMIVELRDRMTSLDLIEAAGASPLTGGTEARAAARADALAALESLGFTRATAEKNLRKVLRDHPSLQSADEMIRLALREQG